MIAFLGGIAVWDWLATRQEHKRGPGPSNSRSAQGAQDGVACIDGGRSRPLQVMDFTVERS